MKFKLPPPKDTWQPWFAWYPVKTQDGYRVWLETVFRKWNYEKNFRIIDPYDPGDYDGGWDYWST
jgi:hypothetical protein